MIEYFEQNAVKLNKLMFLTLETDSEGGSTSEEDVLVVELEEDELIGLTRLNGPV